MPSRRRSSEMFSSPRSLPARCGSSPPPNTAGGRAECLQYLFCRRFARRFLLHLALRLVRPEPLDRGRLDVGHTHDIKSDNGWALDYLNWFPSRGFINPTFKISSILA